MGLAGATQLTACHVCLARWTGDAVAGAIEIRNRPPDRIDDTRLSIGRRTAAGVEGAGADDPEPPRPHQEHFVTARRRFNLIAIANSDASGAALTRAAIDQANRALNEIVLVQPQPDFEFA